MRLTKETVIKREARALELFGNGLDIAGVNDTLFQETGMRMGLNRLYELRAQHQKANPAPEPEPKPEVVKIDETAEEAVENAGHWCKPTVLETNDPKAFSKSTILHKGERVTVELMEK